MRTLAILFTLFYFLNALAVAPYGFKGQQQSTVLYSNVLQGQNNLVTNMGGINALLETGNKNILTNPSFEHATFSTGWTNSAGTFTADTVVEIDGLKASKLVLSAQTMSLTQSSTLYAAQFADGVQGIASVRVKSDVALKVCSIQAGTVSSTNCVDVVANSKWGLYKVPFILGGTSNGISIASSGAVSGTVYIDDAFVAAVDLQVSTDSSRIAGSSYFAATTGSNLTRTSTTLGAFTAVAAFPGPIITSSSLGTWSTTDSNLPIQTIDNLPAGKYKATFEFGAATTLLANSAFAINDGTTTCESSAGSAATSVSAKTVSCVFTYSTTGTRSFQLFAATSSNSVVLSNDDTPSRSNTKFILEYFGNSSVYSSTNADTDWASCGHTAASFTGFGTPTSIETQCKRQGSDLLMKGKFTGGTPTAVEARLSLPVWNGAQLVSAGSSIIPSIQITGIGRQTAASAGYFVDVTLMEPSVSYVTFGQATSTTSGVAKLNGSAILASGNTMFINARIPIEGWQGSNIIVGSFNGLQNCTSTLDCTDTFSATISSAGVVSNENVDFITGNCSKGGTGITNCTINSGVFSVIPNSVATIDDGAGACREVRSVGTNTTTSFRVDTLTSAGAAADCQFKVIFQKQGADYVGKTAMAVASDQNLRIPGETKSSVYAARGTCSGTPSFSTQRGGVASSISAISAGFCSVTLPSTIFSISPICMAQYDGQTSALNIRGVQTQVNSNTSIDIDCNTSSADCTSFPFNLLCHGVSP